MRRRSAIFLLTLFLLLGFSPAHAASIGVSTGGTSNDGVAAYDFSIVVIFLAAVVASSSTESTAEYSFDCCGDETTADIVEFDAVPSGSGAQAASSQSLGAPSVLNATAVDNPFDSLLIDIQNDITLQDGTPIGDAVAFNFSGGTVAVDGVVIQQLSIKLQDRAGNLVDGIGLDQLLGLDLANTTSATYLTVTQNGIGNGTINSLSVAAVPLPAAAWLFPAGLMAGLGWMRRNRL